MAARKNTSRKKKQKTNEKEAGQPKFLKDEIIILSALAAGILLLIRQFWNWGICGVVAVFSVLFGRFGIIAYIIPILLFTGIAFAISNKGNSIAYIKTVAGVGFTWMVCTLFQLIMNEYTAGTGLFSY